MEPRLTVEFSIAIAARARTAPAQQESEEIRKFLILAATAASALAVATPAAAQWYPPQQHNNGYGYNGYGNQGYGHNDYAGNLGYRINRLQQHIDQFDSRNIISNREARSLRAQAYDLQRQLRYGQGYNVERRLSPA